MLNAQELERHLRQRWGILPEVVRLRVTSIKGAHVVLVEGHGAQPPRAITPTVTVQLGGIAHPVVLRVFWRAVAVQAPRSMPPGRSKPMQPANEQLWAGATPTPDREMDLLDPYRPARQAAIARHPPPAKENKYQAAFNARTLGEPFFWSLPLDASVRLCPAQLGVPVSGVLLRLPDTEEAQLRTISYVVTGVSTGWQVRVRVLTSGGQTIASWFDLVVDDTADPAHQFAMTGSLDPMPLIATVRKGDELVVEFTVMGPYPFNVPYTPITATAEVLINGWINKLNDTRDGAPRPADLGDLNNLAFGMNDTFFTDVDPALVRAVQDYVNATAASDVVADAERR